VVRTDSLLVVAGAGKPLSVQKIPCLQGKELGISSFEGRLTKAVIQNGPVHKGFFANSLAEVTGNLRRRNREENSLIVIN